MKEIGTKGGGLKERKFTFCIYLAGDAKITFSQPMYLSEKSVAHRNYALAHFMVCLLPCCFGSIVRFVRFFSVLFGSVRFCSILFDSVRFCSILFGSVRFRSVLSVRFGSVRFRSVLLTLTLR
jgi:hypothetical protein